MENRKLNFESDINRIFGLYSNNPVKLNKELARIYDDKDSRYRFGCGECPK